MLVKEEVDIFLGDVFILAMMNFIETSFCYDIIYEVSDTLTSFHRWKNIVAFYESNTENFLEEFKIKI